MTASNPVLFIHGLWLHARSWDSWSEHFATGRLRDLRARLAR